MKTIEHRVTDKTDWGEGPWQNEPDKKQWLDSATGLPCLIVRNRMGALCGYVGVPQSHPLFEKDYDTAESIGDFSVHGGLTFAGHCQAGPEGATICHLVEPGEDDNVWWLGFDCAHGGDLSPKHEADMDRLMPGRAKISGIYQETYKDVSYVEAECRSLAEQLKELSNCPY